jgi:hypothetical protein
MPRRPALLEFLFRLEWVDGAVASSEDAALRTCGLGQQPVAFFRGEPST